MMKWPSFLGGAALAACGSFGEANDEPPATNVSPPVTDAGTADVASDGGSSGGSSIGCNGAVDCERVVFVTSVQFYPDELKGAAGADAKCTELAKAAKSARVQNRPFVAWLSEGSSGPVDRFVHSSKPYVLANGKTVAADFAALTGTASHGAPIDVDENGTPAISADIWTGTRPDGTATGVDCAAWTTRDGQLQAFVGTTTKSDQNWSNTKSDNCSTDHRIYCFEK